MATRPSFYLARTVLTRGLSLSWQASSNFPLAHSLTWLSPVAPKGSRQAGGVSAATRFPKTKILAVGRRIVLVADGWCLSLVARLHRDTRVRLELCSSCRHAAALT